MRPRPQRLTVASALGVAISTVLLVSGCASAAPSGPTAHRAPTAAAPVASATASTVATAPVCSLGQLDFSEPGPGGAGTGDWVQLVDVRDLGAACTLPAATFSLGRIVAHAASGGSGSGLELRAHATSEIAASTDIGCGDGSGNTSTLGPAAQPLTVRIGQRDAAGLHRPMPVVGCAGLFVQRLH